MVTVCKPPSLHKPSFVRLQGKEAAVCSFDSLTKVCIQSLVMAERSGTLQGIRNRSGIRTKAYGFSTVASRRTTMISGHLLGACSAGPELSTLESLTFTPGMFFPIIQLPTDCSASRAREPQEPLLSPSHVHPVLLFPHTRPYRT